MRMHFGPDEERSAARAREALVEQFTGWLAGHPEHRGADPSDADLAMAWKFGYADGDYGTWTRDDVDELLLDHLPRKLSASPTEAASVPSSIAALVTFLADRSLLSAESDTAEVLAQRALAQARAFGDAMADPSNFGMGKRLLSSFDLDGEDLPDQAALDRMMAEFNALSFEERGRILGIEDDPMALDPFDGDEPVLRVRPVPDDAALDDLASGVELLRRVDALARAIDGDGVNLTKAGNLTVADGKRLAAIIGTDDVVEGIRSSAELRELFATSQVAAQAGAIEFAGNRMKTAPSWAARPPRERWRAVADAMLWLGPATMRFGADHMGPAMLVDLADDAAITLLPLLWEADEPLPVELLVSIFDEAGHSVPETARLRELPGDLVGDICRDRVNDIIDAIVAAGIGVVDDGMVHMTDGGAWSIAPTLSAAGCDVVDARAVAAMSAGVLLDLVVDRDESVETILPLWTTGRSDDDAARQLVDELRERPEPARVGLGFTMLGHLGPGAVDAVASARDSALAPHVSLFLLSAEVIERDEVPFEHVMWAGIDTLLATADLGTPADVIESLLGDVIHAGPIVFLDDVAACGHPRAGELLELIGRHHPDKAVAKYARKVAHRWRTSEGRGRP